MRSSAGMVLGKGALCAGAGLGHEWDQDGNWDGNWDGDQDGDWDVELGCHHPPSVAEMEHLMSPQHLNDSTETMRETHRYF